MTITDISSSMVWGEQQDAHEFFIGLQQALLNALPDK